MCDSEAFLPEVNKYLVTIPYGVEELLVRFENPSPPWLLRLWKKGKKIFFLGMMLVKVLMRRKLPL